MFNPKAKKICIVVSSLGVGGAERSSALLSELLFDLGYDVHIVSVLDKIDYAYKGKLLNLGELKTLDNSSLGRFKRLNVFRKYLKDYNFDYIIDNRTRIGLFKEFILSKLIYDAKKTIYCVRSHNTNLYVNPNRFLGRLLYKSAYKIVLVSNAISDALKLKYGFINLEVIHNPVDLSIENSTHSVDKKNGYILFYGRLDDGVKNISLLLEAYKMSKLPKENIKLKILGRGEDESLLKGKSKSMNLGDMVEFCGYQSNPFSIVKEAYFTILTSRYEGFPRVLVESLALGVPVVSVDCKSGPSEIVTNEHNGLLVENHNVEVLAKAMDRMLTDEDLYLHCKSNAKSSVQKFSKENIGQQWMAILK